MFSSNVAFEDLVLSKASPSESLPDAWRVTVGEVCIWKVSVGLKCVRTSRMDSFLNLPLYTHVSRKVISVSEISAVDFMVVFNQLLLENLSEMNFHDLKQIIHE